jgi:hypothetical protein
MTGGATGASAGSGNINSTVTVPPGGTVTYVATGTINSGATGNLVNTATVTAPSGTTDPVPGNNSATDSDLLNHPPVPGPMTVTRYPSQSVKIAVADLLTHVTDADVGDTVTITAVSGGGHGTPTLSTTNGTSGFVFYTPNAGDKNGDVFSYTATDNHGVSAVGTITVNIITDNGPSMNMTFRGVQPDGSVALDFSGIPGRTYGLQFSTDLVHWTTIKPVTTDQYGSGHVVDAPAHVTPSGFYRMIYPYAP